MRLNLHCVTRYIYKLQTSVFCSIKRHSWVWPIRSSVSSWSFRSYTIDQGPRNVLTIGHPEWLSVYTEQTSSVYCCLFSYVPGGIALPMTADTVIVPRFKFRNVDTVTFLQRAQCSHCKRCISYGNSVRLSVCLSVCPSHAGIVSKRRHVARCSLHRWIAKCV